MQHSSDYPAEPPLEQPDQPAWQLSPQPGPPPPSFPGTPFSPASGNLPTQPLQQPPNLPNDTAMVSPAHSPQQLPTQPGSGAYPPPIQQLQPEPRPGLGNWINFSQLQGHPLVNIREGREIGTVADLLLDDQRRIIQAFATKKGILRGSIYVPAVRAVIGADAITFHPGALADQDTSWLDRLPRASDLIGRRILSDTGQLLGTVDNIRFEQSNGMLVAFEVAPEHAGILHRLSKGRRLLPSGNIITYGPDAIIASAHELADL